MQSWPLGCPLRMLCHIAVTLWLARWLTLLCNLGLCPGSPAHTLVWVALTHAMEFPTFYHHTAMQPPSSHLSLQHSVRQVRKDRVSLLVAALQSSMAFLCLPTGFTALLTLNCTYLPEFSGRLLWKKTMNQVFLNVRNIFLSSMITHIIHFFSPLFLWIYTLCKFFCLGSYLVKKVWPSLKVATSDKLPCVGARAGFIQCITSW